MKIIHVISALTKGGAERVAVELANTAVENGDEVTIIAGWPVDPFFLQNIIDPKVILKFTGKTKNTAYINIIPWIIKNRKWICSQDVLHCHLTYGAIFGSVIHILLKKIVGKKSPIIIETNHAVGMSVPRFNRWFHSRMQLLRNGLVLVAKDPYWNNFITKHPRLKGQIICNGILAIKPNISAEQKQQFLKEIAMPVSSKYLVGTVGMLRPDRKPWLYVPLFKEVNNALGNEVYFILAGGGLEYDNIKTLLKENGLTERVFMPGLVNDPAAIIPNMDLYVSVSVGATTGISMVEAAMCKVPVVGIQMDEKYTAKDTDWVWSNSDIKEVAEKIVYLLQNNTERNMLAAKQYEYVNNNFTSQTMYEAYDKYYKKILI